MKPSTAPHKIGRTDSRRRSIERMLSRENVSEQVSEMVSGLLDEMASMGLSLRDLNNKHLGLDPGRVRKEIFKLADAEIDVPDWVMKPRLKSAHSPGMPSILLSDWHWGEVVNKAELNGVNEYNLRIAEARAKRVFSTSVDLLKNHFANPTYPGIVVWLGGDMVSGDIHDELKETNEIPSLPTCVHLAGRLIRMIEGYADVFGKVWVPCVVGNHGRQSKKPQSKRRVVTNYDWLTYTMVESHFAAKEDKRINFNISQAKDLSLNILGHRYYFTHGDEFRGGDGVSGMAPVVARGDVKKRGVQAQVDLPYDTMVIGHWHQYYATLRYIVNGCFPKGSLVITPYGPKPIEGIAEGDEVLSRDGTIQTVTSLFEKKADRLIGLKVYGIPNVLRATPNHLVYAVKGSSSQVIPSRRSLMGESHGPAQWIPIDFLSPNDFVHVPTPKGNNEPIDEETAWAFGLYIAEGSTLLNGGATKKHNRVCLTMHERELHVLNRWADWFEARFGLRPKVYLRTRSSGGTTSELVVSPGLEVCRWFRETFGHLASGKHVPEGALEWSPRLKNALFLGWLEGDGHCAVQADCRDTISATTISSRLAWEMFLVGRSLGRTTSLGCLRAGGRRKSDSFTVHLNAGQNAIEIDGELFFRVHERFENVGDWVVHDLEVSGEHTYCVEGIGVHNSLKGYDQFARDNTFPWEPPRQAMWITHPDHGVTFNMPVHADAKITAPKQTSWVSWPKVG